VRALGVGARGAAQFCVVCGAFVAGFETACPRRCSLAVFAFASGIAVVRRKSSRLVRDAQGKEKRRPSSNRIPCPPPRIPHLTTPARRASTSAATKRRSGRRQLFRNVVAGSGTTLRSLCWLLLHCRRHVSEGAAAVLLTLATTDAGHRKGRSEAGIAAWVVLGLVEQGCVPILRMAAGRPGVLSSPTTRGKGGVGAPAAAVAAAAAAGMAREGCRGDVPRQTARAVLEAVVQEACGRHVDRLVHSLAGSGDRELRGNVTLALGILSAGTGGDQGRKVI